MKPIIMLLAIILSLYSQEKIETGISFFNTKEYEKAKDVFETILDMDDEINIAWDYLGQTYFFLKDYSESVDCFERINEDSMTIEQYKRLSNSYIWYSERANIFSKFSISKRLINLLRKVTRMDSNDLILESKLISRLLNAPKLAGGNTEEGLIRLTSFKHKAPYKSRYILFKYHLKNNDLVLAKSVLDEIKRLEVKDDNYSSLYHRYGYYLLENDLNLEAVNAFLELVKLAPKSANSYDSLGDAYRALGKLDSALIVYKNALVIDPNFEPSKENIDDLIN